MDGVPRRINALINLTYTSQNTADAVVEELKRALEEKKIPFKQIDFLLRCKISDDWGKIRYVYYVHVCSHAHARLAVFFTLSLFPRCISHTPSDARFNQVGV